MTAQEYHKFGWEPLPAKFVLLKLCCHTLYMNEFTVLHGIFSINYVDNNQGSKMNETTSKNTLQYSKHMCKHNVATLLNLTLT